MTKICLFPGQGSQKKGMGQELFPLFPAEVAAATEVLGYDIAELCVNDPDGKLGQTRFTQPALYTVNCLAFLKDQRDTGAAPDYLAGHSLGEYCALFAAGVFDFTTGLKLVRERGALMQEATGGGMAAVIGLPLPRIQELLASPDLNGIDIANYNAPGQIVIAGPRADIERAKPAFEQAGAQMFIVLNVSGAFHSRYMAPSARDFAFFLDNFTFANPRIPVVANTTARPYEEDMVEENLVRQIDHSVRWQETLEFLLGLPDPRFLELGPGNVLTGLLRRTQAALKPAA